MLQKSSFVFQFHIKCTVLRVLLSQCHVYIYNKLYCAISLHKKLTRINISSAQQIVGQMLVIIVMRLVI